MKKIFVIMLLAITCTGNVFAYTLLLTQNNLNHYINQSPLAWSGNRFMKIINNSEQNVTIKINMTEQTFPEIENIFFCKGSGVNFSKKNPGVCLLHQGDVVYWKGLNQDSGTIVIQH